MIKEKSKTWDAVSRALGRCFSPIPVGPNLYSWLTLPTGTAGCVLVILGRPLLGTALFTLSGLLDLIDGAVARHRGTESAKGAFLDGSLDRFVDFLLIFSYFWLPLEVPWLPVGAWLALAVFFTIMPSFEVAYGNHRKAVVDPDETIIWRLLNRGEMFVLMLLILLVSTREPAGAGWLLVALVALAALTTVQTFVATLRRA